MRDFDMGSGFGGAAATGATPAETFYRELHTSGLGEIGRRIEAVVFSNDGSIGDPEVWRHAFEPAYRCDVIHAPAEDAPSIAFVAYDARGQALLRRSYAVSHAS